MSGRGYDEFKPATWTVRQLLDYAAANEIAVMSGMEKGELVPLVDRHLTDKLLREELRKRTALLSDRIDVVGAPVEDILRHVAYPDYSATLRQHPDKLRAIIDAGIAELHAPSTIATLRNLERHPPVEAWLFVAANGTDEGAAFRAALAGKAGSSVCGKYFQRGEVVVRCMDCGVDPTCVMCLDCFNNSPCRSHRYEISHGSGGGMCDCGDPTAWKPESFCTRHRGIKEDDDPLAGVDPADVAWLTAILRGIVQFVTVVLQHAIALEERKRGKKSGLGEEEEEDGDLSLSDRDWLADWLKPVGRALVALEGDCAKRLLGGVWVEPTPLPSAVMSASAGEKEASCLEVLFIRECGRDKKVGQASKNDDEPWWKDVLQAAGNCLSDPVFRVPFAALYVTYGERIETSAGRLHDLSVQFMTSTGTMRALLFSSPSLLPYSDPHDTILHRTLSSVVYFLSQVCHQRSGDDDDDDDDDTPTPVPPGCMEGLFRIRWHTPNALASSLSSLSHLLMSCNEAATVTIISRSFLRAWHGVLLVLHISSGARRDPNAVTGVVCDAQWLSNLVHLVLLRMQSALRRLLRHLAGDGRADDDADDRPVLPGAIVAAASRSVAFDAIPNRAARTDIHARFLRGAVGDLGREGRPAILPVTEGSTGYMLAYLEEILRAVDSSLQIQRRDFQKIDATARVVLARAAVPIHAYSLLDPDCHAVSVVNIALRSFSLAIRVWVVEEQRRRRQQQQQQQQHKSGGGQDDADDAAAVRLHGRPAAFASAADQPLIAITETCLGGDQNQERREGIIDAALMPSVLCAQICLGMWRRDDYGVSGIMDRYVQVQTNISLYQDVYLLQLAALHTPPQDYALRVLERFSFGHRQTRGVEPPPLPPGCASFLRMMLTVITDTTKADRDHSSECAPRIIRLAVANLLGLEPRKYSTLLTAVQLRFRGMYADDTETDEEGNSVQVQTKRAVEELAVAEQSRDGKIFRIKDSATWCSYVSVYNPLFMDMDLPSLYSTYSRLSISEQVARAKATAAASAGGEGEQASGAARTQMPRLPPTPLRSGEQYGELVPPLRALLHTDALLVTAIHVVMKRAYQLRAEASPASAPGGGTSDGNKKPLQDAVMASIARRLRTAMEAARGPRPAAAGADAGENSSDDDDDDDDDKDGNVSEELLLHAVTALYLCVLDCAAITEADAAKTGVVPPRGPSLGGVGGGAEVAPPAVVNWHTVEEYIKSNIATPYSFNREHVKRLFGLPELMGAQSVKAKLSRRVPTSRFGGTSPPPLGATTTADAAAPPLPSSLSPAEALHDLRHYLRANEREDKFSLTHMIEYVLSATGLATFTVEVSAEEAAAAAAAEAEAKSRQQRVKDKQAKLLARLRSRGAKASAAVTSDGSKPTPVGEDKQPAATASGSGGGASQLHTKLLLELASQECAVCRSATDEPLMLLAHTSSSGVLSHLQSAPLPEGRNVHSNFYVCGHAAHKSCTEKVFGRLSLLWRRGYFQGQRFLGPAEFSCPVCVMVCTALAPFPVLAGSAEMAATTAPHGRRDATLFEEIRRGTREVGGKAVDEACAGLHNALAQASIGLSPNEDGGAIVSTEDDLQRSGSSAWQLSESIRTIGYHLQLMLETAKAGVGATAIALHRDCIALLSLLVSLPATELQTHREALEKAFQGTGEDLCCLILHVLREPRQAAQHIACYADALAASSEGIRALVERNTARALDEEAPADAALPIAVWKELGCMTLLKLLVVADDDGDGDDAAARARAERVLGTTGADGISLHALSPDMISTPGGVAESIGLMWAFVSSASIAAASTAVSPRLRPLVRPALPALANYATPASYRDAISGVVLHMPHEYIEVLSGHLAVNYACSKCGQQSVKPVLCCYCGKHFCLQPRNTNPELFEHSRTCAGGVGVFIFVKGTQFVVLDAVAGRALEYSSVYTDEHGETDNAFSRGRRLTKDEEATSRLLSLWLRGRWGVESSTIKESWRHGVREL